MTGVHRTRIALAGLWLVVTLFNLTKAIHIDDSTYLLIARQILEDPLHPMSGRLVLSGQEIPISTTNQPPLLFYCYALVMAAFGPSELALHLLLSLFSAAAIVLFHGLARRLCPAHALLLTATFCLGPAFLPSQNLMTDVPLLAFWLAFFRLLIDRPSGAWPAGAYAAASAVAGAACLVKYPSLVLLPLLAGVLALRRDWRAAWTPLVALGILAAWSAFNWADYGEIHVLSRESGGLARGSLPGRGIDWLVALGAVGPFSVLVVPWALRRWRAAVAVAALLVLAAWLHGRWSAELLPVDATLSRLFFCNGALVLLCAGASLLTERSQHVEPALLLAGWISAAAAFVVLLAPFMAVRHVLLAAPALLLALGRGVGGRGARGWMAAACAATAALGAALAVSDWVYADLYRTQARALRERFGDDAQLWYLGNWGWRWYAEEQGMRPYLPGRSQLSGGDLVVIPEIPTGPKEVSRRDRRRVRHVYSVTVPSSAATRLRTMRPQPVGGYYGFESPGLPWSLGSEPLEEFTILRVTH